MGACACQAILWLCLLIVDFLETVTESGWADGVGTGTDCDLGPREH